MPSNNALHQHTGTCHNPCTRQHVGAHKLTDTQLTIGAMLVEIGVPIAVSVTLFVAPKFRPFCYSILGSVTPLLFGYLSTIVSTWNIEDPAEKWAVGAMWVMSFFPYVISLTVGVSLGLSSIPKHSVARFVLSAVVSISVLWAILTFA